MADISNRPDLVIIGAGGFGREVLDVVDAISATSHGPHWNFLGFVDDSEPNADLLRGLNAEWLGGTPALGLLRGCSFVVGVGSGTTRRALARVAVKAGIEPATLIHPTATLGRGVDVGPGTIICSHVSVTTHVKLGRHVHLNLNCTVGHDSVLEDFVTVFPGVTVSGNVVLKSGVTMGTNSTVIQGVSIGAGSTIGAGAAVVRDVPEGVTAVGVPAKPIINE